MLETVGTRDALPARRDAVEIIDGPVAWLTLSKLVDILYHQRFLMVLAGVVCGCLAWLATQQLTPVYRTGADILLEPDQTNVVDIQKVTTEGALDDPAIVTEAAVLRSQELLRGVVAELEAEFDAFPRKTSPPIVRAVKVMIGRVLPVPERDGVSTGAATPSVSPLERKTRFLQTRLEVVTQRSNRVIGLRVESVDPRFAALAANRIAEHYVAERRQARTAATNRAGAWLAGQVERLRVVLVESEARLERARREAGVEEIQDTPVPVYQLLELTRLLGQAKSDLAEAVGRYGQVLSDDVSSLMASSSRSQMLMRLQGEETAQLAKVAELRQKYRNVHPALAAARAALAEIRARIDLELERSKESLRQDAAVAQEPVTELQAEIGQLLGEISDINKSEILLASLESEVSANRALFDTLLQRLKELDGQEALQDPGARIINRAIVPARPVFPPTNLFVALAVLLGVGGAATLILFKEVTRRDFRDRQHVEVALNTANVGVIPECAPTIDDVVGGVVFAHSAEDQTFSRILASLAAGGARGGSQSVLITSAVSGEGKSITSLRLASAAADVGRCLLIECSTLRPSLCAYLDKPETYGLTHVLAGEASLEDCVRRDPARGFDYLSVGQRMAFDPVTIQRFRHLLQAVSQLYDLVLIDAPALLAAPGTARLTDIVDTTIMIIRWHSTTIESVRRALGTAGHGRHSDVYACLARTPERLVEF